MTKTSKKLLLAGWISVNKTILTGWHAFYAGDSEEEFAVYGTPEELAADALAYGSKIAAFKMIPEIKDRYERIGALEEANVLAKELYAEITASQPNVLVISVTSANLHDLMQHYEIHVDELWFTDHKFVSATDASRVSAGFGSNLKFNGNKP